MNILILNWRDPKHPNAGGAEIVTLAHAKGWISSGHSVTWFCARFTGASSRDEMDGVRILRRGGLYTVYLAAVFYFLTQGHQFDIVIDEIHFVPFFSPFYVGKPVIAFIHEVANEIWDYTTSYPISWLGKTFEKFSFRFYKNISFWTDARSTVKELTDYGIPVEHCTTIPCPIRNRIVSVLPRKNSIPTFLYVSRLVKMKGIEDVIVAFSYIRYSLPQAQLWILGYGDSRYVQSLQLLVHNYGIQDAVRFYGRVSEGEKLKRMRKAHLLLHASVKEGWGLVVLEAASQGTPTIAYNVPGLRDTVRNGETGIIVSDNTPQALATAAVQLFNEAKRYRTFQKKGLVWVRSLTWRKATQKSLRLISSIL